MNPFASIAELSKAIKSKQVSSVELTEMSLGRLESLGRAHNAVAELTRDHAMAQARKADSTTPKHALHGIPFGAKDLLATKGIPTRWGSPGHHDQVFNHDATPIARLYDKGAVLVAKLAMIELAGGGNYNVAHASATGACLSAWDKERGRADHRAVREPRRHSDAFPIRWAAKPAAPSPAPAPSTG